MKTSFLLIFALFLYHSGYSQKKIGLVLSGGGASALAHVGVLKALEEFDIPIDCVASSSAGALVGSLYSCGYSPQEIEQFILSEDFLLMSKGGLRPENQFLIREKKYDASTIGFSLAKDSIVRKSIPLNLVTPTLLDFEMLKVMGHTSASVGHNIVDAEFLTSASLIFHRLVGPIRATLNYFPKQKDPLSFQVSYGYVIFNNRAIR